MSRRCVLTGKHAQAGNNVSHSNRKTRRRFHPNMQRVSLMSDILKQTIKLSVPVSTLRTIEHNGGIDAYLLSTSNLKLTKEARSLKAKLLKAKTTQVAA